MTKEIHKFLCKVEERRYLKLGEIIYFDITPQKNPSYAGSNNWILVQNSDTKQIWSFSIKSE